MRRSAAGSVAGKTMVTATVVPARERPSLLWLNLVALLLVLASAFAVIHSTHACRELYARLQVLESSQWALQEDYGRLLLEESVWASHHRVESVARAELQMTEPDLARYRVVAP
jgi:cell division protein FtsL